MRLDSPQRFWFADDESQTNVVATRILLSIAALWIVLSRFDFPSVLEFPQAMWDTVPFERRIRFVIVFPVVVERALWIALHVCLLLTIVGWRIRATCFIGGLLLYHFGPFETVFWTPNPYLRGFTLPAVGFLCYAFATNGNRTAPWALKLTQFQLTLVYFFAGYSKLFASGIAWMSARNIRLYVLALDQYLGFSHAATPLSRLLASSPVACMAIGILGLTFDLTFPVVLFSRRSRWILVPAALLFHVANAVVFHVMFQNFVLLFTFVNWDPVWKPVREFFSFRKLSEV